MKKPSSRVSRQIASLALAVVDLRAHFEAQLRTVARVEEALVKCRMAMDPAAFESSADALRGQVKVLSDNNRSGGVGTVIEQLDADARDLQSRWSGRRTGGAKRVGRSQVAPLPASPFRVRSSRVR